MFSVAKVTLSHKSPSKVSLKNAFSDVKIAPVARVRVVLSRLIIKKSSPYAPVTCCPEQQSLPHSLKRCSTRTCFSPIRLSLPLSCSSSPELWWRPRTWNVALRRVWDPSPTPCCLALFVESFPANAWLVASTLSLALPAQSFALQKVCQILLAPTKAQYTRWCPSMDPATHFFNFHSAHWDFERGASIHSFLFENWMQIDAD